MKFLRAIAVISSLLLAGPVLGQSRGQFALPDLGSDVRNTKGVANETVINPFWHGANDPESNPPTGFTFAEDEVATSIDFRDYCSAPEDYTGTGTRVVTVTGGAIPTAMSFGTSTLSGTPSTSQSGSFTLTCTLDGAGTFDEDFTFTVEGTDTTAPPTPSNLECGPTDGTSDDEVTCTWDAVTDISGILRYPIRYASDQATCDAASGSTLLENSTDTTAALGGLTANTTRWFKVRAQDNALNQSAFTACIPATTDDGVGGGDSEELADENFETGTDAESSTDDQWNQSQSCNGTPSTCCVDTISTTGGADRGSKFLRTTLIGDPDGGNYRCEQNLVGFGNVATGPVDLGDIIYYGISYRIPAETDFDSNNGDTIQQWHHQPTTNPNCHHSIRLENNTIIFHSNGCPDLDTPGATLISPVTKGQWFRVCLRAVWDTDGDGRLKLWLNADDESDTPVFNFSGQTITAAFTNIAKFKIGDYKTKWRTNNTPPNVADVSPRVIDTDDVRIFKGADGFEDACAPL